MEAKQRTKGTIYVLISAIFFSLGGLLVKKIPWGSLSINSARSLLSFWVIAIFMRSMGHRFRLNRIVFFGAVCNTIMGLFFVMATKMTSAANAIVLQFMEPIFVIFIMWIIFKKRPKKEAIIACSIALCGMLCFFMDKLTMSGMIGNILAILSGLAYAFVFTIKRFPGGDMESSLLVSHVLSFIIGLPSLLGEQDRSMSVLIFVVVLGIFQFGFSYVFLSKGLDHISPLAASLTSMIEPILNPVLVAIFYGELIGPVSMFGAALVIGAVTWYQIKAASVD